MPQSLPSATAMVATEASLAMMVDMMFIAFHCPHRAPNHTSKFFIGYLTFTTSSPPPQATPQLSPVLQSQSALAVAKAQTAFLRRWQWWRCR